MPASYQQISNQFKSKAVRILFLITNSVTYTATLSVGQHCLQDINFYISDELSPYENGRTNTLTVIQEMGKNLLCLPFGGRHVLNSEFILAVNTCLLLKTKFLRGETADLELWGQRKPKQLAKRSYNAVTTSREQQKSILFKML